MAERSKAPDSRLITFPVHNGSGRSGLRMEAWVRIPLLTWHLFISFIWLFVLLMKCEITEVRQEIEHQILKALFHRHIHREESCIYDAQRSIFDEIRGVWTAYATLSLVFERSSQSEQKLRSKGGNKIIKICSNFEVVIFFCFYLRSHFYISD